ncbi:cyclodeaminase [Sporolactobacillus shoreicorticis]|uniref:Cyclodeaminase n=1 Tax=Sporolactobacillus shoreicorticis TaxID=1923877 RepID=A0ABW5S347_9BACL|nr:cyclodeaminase [Sporolactobacillus shoreicorticis]MCO7124255.1 cyclodeaminase [Sporolactobacillus shoreicorticis]
MHLYHEEAIRSCVALNRTVIQKVEDGFTQLDQGNAAMPPIMSIDIPENSGEVDIKSAYIKGLDTFAIKISSGFFNNKALGLPSLSGMMLLMSSVTGLPEAILMDNGYLTDVRTAAAGAIAADYLAKPHIDTAGVIGTGLQARLQMEALYLVRPYKKLLVYGRRKEAVDTYIAEMSANLGVAVESVPTPEQLVKQSEIVVTTTPAKAPIIKTEWLHKGLHITAMGADTGTKQEIDEKIFHHADLIVCDVIKQCKQCGELHHALEHGVLSLEDSRIIELGALTSGNVPGRENDDQITLCDLTGTGVQDTAIARYALQQLKAESKGNQTN